MTDQWDELLAKAEAATPGPWKSNFPGEDLVNGADVYAAENDSCPIACLFKGADADYIAAVSPDVVKALIEWARETEGQLARAVDDEGGQWLNATLIRSATEWKTRALAAETENEHLRTYVPE